MFIHNTPLLEPPEFGEISFAIEAKPISRQGKSPKKLEISKSIRKVTHPVRYLLSGEVQIDIEWYVHEKQRYETAESPDIDNILKPLVDALCGPDGLLINDCQVQAVSSAWVDWTSKQHLLNFRIKFFPDEWIQKDKLVFVRIQKNLFFPMHLDLPLELANCRLASLEKMLSAKDEIEERVGDYYSAKRCLPTQQFFHRARLNGFRILEKEEYCGLLS